MGHRGQGIGLGEPGIIYFIAEGFVVPDQGGCVDLSTRIYLDHHQLGAITGGKLESGEESYLAIRHFLGEQGTFWLGHHCNVVSEYDVNTILGIPVRVFAGNGNGETGRVTHYKKGYGKSCRRYYGLGCSGGMTVCLKTSWNGFLSACLSFSRGSDYLFSDCCGAVTVSCVFFLHRQ